VLTVTPVAERRNRRALGEPAREALVSMTRAARAIPRSGSSALFQGVICPMERGGRESHARDFRNSAILLFGFESLGQQRLPDVCWAPDYRAMALPLRFLVIFDYGGLIP
jgi:hypothetical protein